MVMIGVAVETGDRIEPCVEGIVSSAVAPRTSTHNIGKVTLSGKRKF